MTLKVRERKSIADLSRTLTESYVRFIKMLLEVILEGLKPEAGRQEVADVDRPR